MRAGQPSRTAEHNAFFRALETARPAGRRIVADPLARELLGRPLRLATRAAWVPGVREGLPRWIDHRWPGVRPSVVARTRLIDAAVAEAIEGEGADQLVLLGAGHDTRAHRLVCLREVTVFEVDHPDTQRAKRHALGRATTPHREDVRYVPVDLAGPGLDAALDAAGHRRDRRAVIVWEGVTNYLTEDAVRTTLGWCAGAAVGSTLIFTYVHRDVIDDPTRFAGTDRLFATLDHVGERLRFGIAPADLPALLAEHGLRLDRDLGAVEYRALVYGDAASTMHGHEFYRVATATVVGTPG